MAWSRFVLGRQTSGLKPVSTASSPAGPLHRGERGRGGMAAPGIGDAVLARRLTGILAQALVLQKNSTPFHEKVSAPVTSSSNACTRSSGL
jgi:hypothetical protein